MDSVAIDLVNSDEFPPMTGDLLKAAGAIIGSVELVECWTIEPCHLDQKVGSVVYSYEGVERDVWENRDGEWWVLHHFLHFTHQNKAADCYSTKESALQDWRNKLHRSDEVLA